MPLTGSVLGLVVVRDAVVSFCTGWPSFFFLLPPKQPKFSPKTQRFATGINYRSGSWLIGLVNIARAARVRVLPNDGKWAFQLRKHWDLRMRRLDMNEITWEITCSLTPIRPSLFELNSSVDVESTRWLIKEFANLTVNFYIWYKIHAQIPLLPFSSFVWRYHHSFWVFTR